MAANETRIVLPAEFERILATRARPRFRDLLITTRETGCRPQESLRVAARHVELNSARWVLPAGEAKGDYLRVVYLTEKALEITRRLTCCHAEGPLFRNSRGMPWTTDAVNCAFLRIQRQMGLRRMQVAGVEIDEREVQKLAKELRSKRLVKGESVRVSDRALLGEARRKLTRQLAKQHARRRLPLHSAAQLGHSRFAAGSRWADGCYLVGTSRSLHVGPGLSAFVAQSTTFLAQAQRVVG